MRRSRCGYLALQHRAYHNLASKSLSGGYYLSRASDPAAFHQLYIHHIGCMYSHYINGIFKVLAAFICDNGKWRARRYKSQSIDIGAFYGLFHKLYIKTGGCHLV